MHLQTKQNPKDSMTEQGIAVSCHNVHFRYFQQNRKNILDGCSMTVRKGTITVLMGRSGCGKSTLAALLSGLYPENGGFLEDGSIQLFGKPIEGYPFPERAAHVSMMFQNPDLQFCMRTLRKEMRFCLENLSCPCEQMDARIEKAAEATGMTNFLDRDLFTLSGGEKQKAELTCIFLLQSKLIVLDEPFGNIDMKWARKIRDLLIKKNKEDGTTILIIFHSLDYFMDYFDELKVMDSRGTICEGITRETLTQYESLFRREGLRWPYDRHGGTHPDLSGQVSIPSITLQSASIYAGKKRHTCKSPILSGVEAIFPKGRITAILGPSGSGKTTLFRAILGQQKYDGSICLEGNEVKKMSSAKRFQQVGIVFQNPSNQFITHNVLQEVEEGLKTTERNPDALEKKAKDLLKAFHLERFVRYSPYMLSQGQQRRLAVLAILSGTQKVLLLDEPTYGQDDAMTKEIMTMLRNRVEEEGLTVVLTTHDLAVVQDYADTCYLVQDGILKERSMADIDDGKIKSFL